MPFGLTDSQRQLLLGITLKELTDHKVTIWVFGSRVRGDFKLTSDIDLLIETKPPLEPKLKRRIQAALEESRFPLKVDLVLPGEVYPSYQQTIEKEKQLFFPK